MKNVVCREAPNQSRRARAGHDRSRCAKLCWPACPLQVLVPLEPLLLKSGTVRKWLKTFPLERQVLGETQ